jgi:uncharacterized membrane protein YkvI
MKILTEMEQIERRIGDVLTRRTWVCCYFILAACVVVAAGSALGEEIGIAFMMGAVIGLIAGCGFYAAVDRLSEQENELFDKRDKMLIAEDRKKWKVKK